MCNKEQLVGYLYDELDAAERTTFEGHLATCAACRAEVGGLRRTGSTSPHGRRRNPSAPSTSFAAQPLHRPLDGGSGSCRSGRWLLRRACSCSRVPRRLRTWRCAMALTGSWCAPAGLRPLQRPHPRNASADAGCRHRGVVRTIGSGRSGAREPVARARARAQSRQTVKASATMQAAITAGTAEDPDPERGTAARDGPSGLADLEGLQRCAGHRLRSIAGCDWPGSGVTNQQLRQHRDSIEDLSRVSASQQR